MYGTSSNEKYSKKAKVGSCRKIFFFYLQRPHRKKKYEFQVLDACQRLPELESEIPRLQLVRKKRRETRLKGGRGLPLFTFFGRKNRF